MYHPVAEKGPSSTPEREARHILVIHNPTSGQRNQRRYRAVMKILGELGVSISERSTSRRGDAEKFVAEIPPSGCDAIVVAGGDGTINEAANGLRGDSPPLGIVPLGTANVFAAELDLSTDPYQVAHTIAHAQPSAIHFGIVNDRRFVMMAGIGIDAHIVQGVAQRLKHMTGMGAYVWQTLVELSRVSSSTYSVIVDGVRHEVGSAVFANGHFYGGRFVAAPGARLEDGTLHACLLMGRGRWNLARYGMALALNRLSRLGDVMTIEFENADIDGPVGDPVQADGDIVCGLPATIRADSTPVHILRPDKKPAS